MLSCFPGLQNSWLLPPEEGLGAPKASVFPGLASVPESRQEAEEKPDAAAPESGRSERQPSGDSTGGAHGTR